MGETMTALGLVIGAALAAGVLLVIDGARPRPASSAPAAARVVDIRRVSAAVAAGMVVAVLTRWPVAALVTALAVWFAPVLFGGKQCRERAMERTEAIATWTEMLRDTITASHGLEAAITATAQVSPPPIRAEVQQLVRRIEHDPLPVALADLAVDLAHPIADLVVAALSAAATQSTRDLAELLSTLAGSARDEASMQLRIEATRARMRTAVRIIAGVTVTTAATLILLNRSYIEVYGTVIGQVMLAFIFACWGTALLWLARMSQFSAPERFLLPRSADQVAS